MRENRVALKGVEPFAVQGARQPARAKGERGRSPPFLTELDMRRMQMPSRLPAVREGALKRMCLCLLMDLLSGGVVTWGISNPVLS